MSDYSHTNFSNAFMHFYNGVPLITKVEIPEPVDINEMDATHETIESSDDFDIYIPDNKLIKKTNRYQMKTNSIIHEPIYQTHKKCNSSTSRDNVSTKTIDYFVIRGKLWTKINSLLVYNKRHTVHKNLYRINYPFYIKEKTRICDSKGRLGIYETLLVGEEFLEDAYSLFMDQNNVSQNGLNFSIDVMDWDTFIAVRKEYTFIKNKL
jgi:hypothetical protein